jgi:site-specific DNA-methyltransferase (adenine-specific)
VGELKPYYQDDAVTIYHGDCREVLPTLEAESVDLVLTDPPYFQPATHYVPSRAEGAPKKSIGDMSILELAFKIWCDDMARTVKATSTIYFFCDGQSYPLAFTALYPHAKRVRPLIWDKILSFNGYTWRHQHELIAWAEMKDAERVPTGDGDILRHRAVLLKHREHPAQKPVELCSELIGKHAAAIILDPFMGSGTTLRAAKDLGRKAIGIEIEEQYCEIAAKRMQQEAEAV